MDEKIDRNEEVTLSLAKQEGGALVPRRPESLSVDSDRQVRMEVETLTATIVESLEDRQFMTTLDNLGRPEQELAAKRIELIETRVSNVTKVEGPGTKIPEVVEGMRAEIDKLNPKRTDQSGLASFIAVLPGGNALLDLWWASGIRQTIQRRETIRERIKQIRQGLLGNKQQLTEDSAGLNQLYAHVKDATIAKLQVVTYSCELLLEKLRELYDSLDPDSPKKARVRRAIEVITFRVRMMRLTENALQQSLATIDITTDGNGKIADALEEVATLSTAYLTVAMALYQALAHQQRSIKALVKAREGTTDVMVKTSEMAVESVRSVSEQYFNPVGEMEKVRQSHQNLMTALQTLEDASKNGVVKARESIGQLQDMTAELRKKQDELRGGHVLSQTTPTK